MTDVFVSYSHEDRRVAHEIVNAFQEHGYVVDWDNRIEPGERYNRTLPTRVANAERVAVLWSTSALQSDWVNLEARIAARLRTIAPALVDNSDLPPEFAHFQTFSLSDEATYPESLKRFVQNVGETARRSRGAGVRAGSDVRRAFHARRLGDFEGASDLLSWAFRRFEVSLDDPDFEEFRDADRYKAQTIRVLRALADSDYCGRLMMTLAGESLLPAIDAVLELKKDRIKEELAKDGCVLKKRYRGRFIRVGVIIRPSDGVNDGLLIDKLLSESDHRNGPLQVDCFLLIMSSSSEDRGLEFSQLSEKRRLDAKCIVWRPTDPDDELEKRLLDTAKKLCEENSS